MAQNNLDQTNLDQRSILPESTRTDSNRSSVPMEAKRVDVSRHARDDDDSDLEVRQRDAEPNADPITGTHGSHPVGVGVGAAAAGITGAAIGSIIPGIGTAVGAVVGSVVGAISGGYAGKGVAEAMFPTSDDEYWRESFGSRSYVPTDRGFSYDIDYRDAYRFGHTSAMTYENQSFDTAEPQLVEDWTSKHGTSRLEWSLARDAVRDAWERARNNRTMDSSRD